MRSIALNKKMNVTSFLELVLSLIKSGFSVPCTLQILEEKEATKEYADKIIRDLIDGKSFSKALCSLNSKLEKYEAVLRAGEETGDAAFALEAVLEELKEEQKTRRNFIAAAVYPALVVSLAFSLSIVLLKCGIPYINLIAEVDEKSLVKAILMAGFWLIVSAFWVFFLTRYFFYKYDFECTVFKNLYHMNKNKVGMEEAFEILLLQRCFSRRELLCITKILTGLRRGEKLYELCEKYGCFDVFSISWLFVSEENGEVTSGLKKIYENYRAKQKAFRENLLKFLEPALLLISGVYILILVWGCVVPVFMSLGEKIL